MTSQIEITKNGNTRILSQNDNVVVDNIVQVKQELNCITTETRRREKKFSSVGLASRYIKGILDIERRRGSEITHDMRLRQEKRQPRRKQFDTIKGPFTRVLGRSVPV